MTNEQAYLEHANLTVPNIDDTVNFISTALPEFGKRGEGVYKGRRWIHIGTDSSYLAVNEVADRKPTLGRPLNHLGFVVNDVNAVAERLLAAGYQRSFNRVEHPHRIRDYFEDQSGTEYEFVQYLSEDPQERNSYED